MDAVDWILREDRRWEKRFERENRRNRRLLRRMRRKWHPIFPLSGDSS